METVMLVVTAVLSSHILREVVVWFLNRKRNKINDNNLFVDTAEKLVKASSETIERLTTRITQTEEELKKVKVAQIACESREKTVLLELGEVRAKNEMMQKQIDQLNTKK